MIRRVKPSIIAIVVIFAALQVVTGILMIVQYGRLTSFITCQAQYNESTSDSRDARLPAQVRDQQGVADVIAAVKTGDQTAIQAAITRSVKAHENYLEIQKENPYKPPSDFCNGAASR